MCGNEVLTCATNCAAKAHSVLMHTSRAPQRGWTVQWDRWRILCVADDGFIWSFLDLLDVNEVVGDGIDGETGDTVDSEFAGDVLAMREHRVEGDEKFSRNFFV